MTTLTDDQLITNYDQAWDRHVGGGDTDPVNDAAQDLAARVRELAKEKAELAAERDLFHQGLLGVKYICKGQDPPPEWAHQPAWTYVRMLLRKIEQLTFDRDAARLALAAMADPGQAAVRARAQQVYDLGSQAYREVRGTPAEKAVGKFVHDANGLISAYEAARWVATKSQEDRNAVEAWQAAVVGAAENVLLLMSRREDHSDVCPDSFSNESCDCGHADIATFERALAAPPATVLGKLKMRILYEVRDALRAESAAGMRMESVYDWFTARINKAAEE